jgi:V-type H+-transporting ATPase subunit a
MKEKQIYSTLNLSRQQDAVYIMRCWIPYKKEQLVMKALSAKDQDMLGGQINPLPNENNTPPTYFKLNEFTAVFQSIVNIYGIPRYKEVNPGLFTITTFPFLFAVMFGDILHGTVLLSFAIYMVLFANHIKKNKGALSAMVPYRYFMLLMGLFAVFTGMIYNDFTSIQFDLFGSCYTLHTDDTITKDPNCTYPFGLDPIWSISKEEIAFGNSLKMKMAVIIGVA